MILQRTFLLFFFSVLLFIGITCFCEFAYFKWIKGKKLFKKKYTNY